MTVRRLPNPIAILLLAVPALLVAACGSGGADSSTGPGLSMALAGGGNCSVKITGGIEKSWTQQQTTATLLVSQWLKPADREVLSLKAGEASFIFNCEGAAGSISVMLGGGTTEQQFLEAPADYVIAPGTIGGGAPAGQMSLLVNLHDDASWTVSEPGAFNITTFGDGKVGGTFEATLVKTDGVGSPSATGTISGIFDLGCTGTNCH